MSVSGYPTLENRSESSIRFYFVSTGEQTIVKAIDYTQVGTYEGKRVFNLAFGDYDELENRIIDSSHSNNGDVYRVFYTVLDTIPKFFATFKEEIMMVQGSDSQPGYLEKCKLTCRKNCLNSASCKNKDKRINIYRNYVNREYASLIEEYSFFGGFQTQFGTTFEPYEVEKKYDAVFVIRK